MANDREFDLVLFGGTGFTGGLTAEYLAANAPANLRWALAGRNPARVDVLRRDLAVRIDDRFEDLPLIEADSFDYESLLAMARRTKVVITTVGPYFKYGELLVKACAEAGTHYADLTGEPEFVDTMFLRYQDAALKSGARLVHCCGFDSIPADIGVFYTVAQLPDDKPISIDGFVNTNGSFSAGTMHTALTIMSRVRQGFALAKVRKEKDVVPAGRKARFTNGGMRKLPNGWALPLPTIDPYLIVRSAHALPSYGPDFSYRNYVRFKRLPTALAFIVGVSLTMGLAHIPPARKAVLRFFNPGSGPSRARRARSTFEFVFVAKAGERTIRTRVSGGDPGYDETSKMLAETGLSLALDDLEPRAGQLTPAAAMGQHLLERLMKADMRFEVLSS